MLKMTKQRKQILEILNAYHKPVSAEDIYFNNLEGLTLSTIYRTLDTFYNHDLLNKHQLKNVSYYTLKTKTHKHYLVCEKCNKMIEIDCFIHNDLKEILNKHNFKINHHDLTIYGLCSECQKI